MMLASVSHGHRDDVAAEGLPFLGGLPILGRLFTSPTRDNRQIDIVISVTPRVLRAPAVTPRDEEMRPSGTLQSPTTGSLAEMIREADREDQIAAARSLPTNVDVATSGCAARESRSETATQNTTPANLPPTGRQRYALADNCNDSTDWQPTAASELQRSDSTAAQPAAANQAGNAVSKSCRRLFRLRSR